MPVHVDENGVAMVRLGDCAYVTASPFGNGEFRGRVVCIGQEMGPKKKRANTRLIPGTPSGAPYSHVEGMRSEN